MPWNLKIHSLELDMLQKVLECSGEVFYWYESFVESCHED